MKNKYLEKLGGEFNTIKKTNLTHPKVDYEDKYSPFLKQLKEKYSQRLANVTAIDEDFEKNQGEFKSDSKAFLEQSSKIINIFKDALVTLGEFSSAKTLKNPSSIIESFSHFIDIDFPAMTNGTAVVDCFDSYMKFNKFCVQDILAKKCIIKGNQTLKIKEFKNKYAKLIDYNLKNVTKVYSGDLIATTKDVLNIFQGASDMISAAEINSNFNGVTKEYIVELKAMNAYLNKKKPVKISDFGGNNDANGVNIINFERDFKNLIRSSKFICFNIKKPFFIPT